MPESRFRLYDASTLEPVLDAMARQAAALLDDRPVSIIGVLRRGAPLGDLLATRLRQRRPDLAVERTDLRVKRYDDDLTLLHAATSLSATPEQQQAQFAGRQVIVVDDVLYQGYSAFRVFEFLRAQGADCVHLAVLVDRHCSVLPVSADIVGLTLQIAPHDVIECSVPPFEDEFAIDLLRLG